ncbi:MAG TPA: hypothetical protein VLV78_08780 [Thermoanaerobaculia bacterium]|nr:hypothetical protein [Thermoanaerobaculia bacterium]
MITRVSAGIAAAFAVTPLLPLLRPLFGVPGHGIGLVSVNRYPKGWDYAVVLILFAVAGLGTWIAGRFTREWSAGFSGDGTTTAEAGAPSIVVVLLMVVVFLAILPARDHPYAFADPYHEGENLSAASVMMSGGRPYRDIWFMHGIAADGGLDLLVLGDPPSILRTRRIRSVLGAATVALLVPIAAEVSSTWLGVIFGTMASLAAIAAGQLPATPHYRLLPLLLAVWLALIAIRKERRAFLIAACAVASAGLLWSLDVGLFATAGIWGWMILRKRLDWRAAIATILTPLLLLLITRSDISRFFRDSFLRLPECFDAIYSLPAPPLPALSFPWLVSDAPHYYVPPIVYGVLAAAALLIPDRRRGDAMLLLAFVAFVEFRTASGRVSWGHIRFSLPLLGIIVVAFAIEPLIRMKRWKEIALAIVLIVLAIPYFELPANAKDLAGHWMTYRERLHPTPGTVSFPIPRARDLFTYQQEANDVGALYAFSQSQPPGPIFDYSGEKFLYYMLARPAATRCHDIPYLSDPKLGSEAMKQLERHRPVFVVVKGHEVLANIDGVSNRQRTPWLAKWIDANYPQRITIGRYTVGLPSTHEFQPNVSR